MVCENPYGFGDGLGRSRVMTANAGRGPGRLDYLSNTDGQMGNTGLPRIGSQG
jgi:hypothetical protein